MRRRKRNKQRKIIILTSLSLLFMLTVGYAAFQTNLNITAKGNIVEKEITIEELKNEVVTSKDGLYKDTYEDGRYVYKGANPNNYITFNDELWRIISIQQDGTLKIIKKDSIGNKTFDLGGLRDSTSNGIGGTYCAQAIYGCNAWAKNNNFVNGGITGTVLKDAELNTYLNSDYYNNTLTNESKTLIQEHTWGVGGITYNNTDLAAQIVSENSITWKGYIGLISMSDFLRANTNTAQCGNYSLNASNYSICKTTNYIVPSTGYVWTITPRTNYAHSVFHIGSNDDGGSTVPYDQYNSVIPALYLKSDITLKGNGTKDNPYTIN